MLILLNKILLILLRTLYFAIFESHLNYCSLVWSQNCNAINHLVPRNSHSCLLFKKSFILKFLDKVNLENTVSKSINNLLPTYFSDSFLFSSDQHNYETSWSYHGNLQKPSYKTNIYDKDSIVLSAINAWNDSHKLLKILSDIYFLIKSKKRCQIPFLRSIEMSTFKYFKLMLDDFQILQALYSILTFSH